MIAEPFETGIYNRAVLMLAKRTTYTVNLLKELAAIENAPEEELNRTALRHIFKSKDGATIQKKAEIVHEAVVVDTTDLNVEQRQATAAMLTHNITVITGPPGTGKSQVVSSTIVNARLKNQTVLFTSRNHKAIDAVIGRLTGDDGQPLIVRTNSKDDPTLNVNFTHAIRDMLAEQYDIATVEQLKRVNEELASLLRERGGKAISARHVTDNITMLGDLEEKISYLSKKVARTHGSYP
jgi:predicted ATP-dependent serine protease